MEKIVFETAVEIKNVNGLHMRPAMQFVDIANQFTCDISVSDGTKVVDGKSIMQIALLAATHGTKLTIKADGIDAQKAISALQDLVESRQFIDPDSGN